MGWFIFLVMFGGVIFWLMKRRKPEVTDWNTTYKPEVTFTVTTSQDNPEKYIFEPSEDIKKFLKAFNYLGKADGQLREDELIIISNFLIEQQPEHKTSDKWYLVSCIKDIKPFETEDYNDFIQALNKENLSALLVWYKRITGTQKKNHPYEDVLIKELETLIKSKT